MPQMKILLACAFLLPLLAARAEPLEAERDRFHAALDALESRNPGQADALAATLKDYPLYPYLLYRMLDKRSPTLAQQEFFIESYPGSYWAEEMRRAVLADLGKSRDWAEYLKVYKPQTRVALRCYSSAARLALRQDEDMAQVDARDLWLSGASLPGECDAMVEQMDARGLLTSDLLWQRIHLAFDKNNPKLVEHLAKKYLNEAERGWANAWLAVHQQPARNLANYNQPDTALSRQIIRHGLLRLGKDNIAQAETWWQSYQNRYAFTEQEKGEAERQFALAGAKQGVPSAAAKLAALPASAHNDEVCLARAKLALAAQDWKSLNDALKLFPSALRDEPRWRYWQARSQEAVGETEMARASYQNLAQLRDYYGFLSAERAGLPYHMEHQPIRATSEEEQALFNKHGSLARAHEFFVLGMTREARREWQSMLAGLSPREKELAAALARRWNWYDRAIFTAAKAESYDDLEVRFPLAYYPEISAAAAAQGVDLAWAYGITRQESMFMEDAGSSAGALGLMQLMPATGKATARRIGLEIDGNQDILQVSNNTHLGTAYLRQMLTLFGGNYMFATAAYNAGPGRVKRWAAEYGCLPPDVWVELIPFTETQGYVRRVMEYTAVFDARLGQAQRPMRLAPRANCQPGQIVAAAPSDQEFALAPLNLDTLHD